MKWKFSVTFVVMLLFISLTSHIWLPWDPYVSNAHVLSYPSPPTLQNWLGTDTQGRDVLARLVVGFRYSFGFAFSTWLLSSLLAFMSGAWLAYKGGRWDLYGQRFIETLEALPLLVVLLFLSTLFRPNIYWLILVSSLLGWMNLSYYVRAEVLKVKKSEFVLSAQSTGASTWRILFQHIFPHAVFPLLIWMPFMLATSISFLAGLDYLGFGLPVPTPSWGELLQQAFKLNQREAWWLKVFPFLFLIVVLFCFHFIGRQCRLRWQRPGC